MVKLILMLSNDKVKAKPINSMVNKKDMKKGDLRQIATSGWYSGSQNPKIMFSIWIKFDIIT